MTDAKKAPRAALSGVERLSLRVSSMINHRTAQIQRRVTIYRLDTDGEREWEEVMGALGASDDLDVLLCEDGSVTVSWGVNHRDDPFG
ncbi:DUF1654 domain-containing protein [Pseudomonas syringae]|uniref:DUF1654 domain-containing protein n=1 Tax=Pseudomonas syringae TaxID=317 RepID=UPI00177C5E6A|nr:DUF1654 domain-containing protein [Pseudomonas syringae]